MMDLLFSQIHFLVIPSGSKQQHQLKTEEGISEMNAFTEKHPAMKAASTSRGRMFELLWQKKCFQERMPFFIPFQVYIPQKRNAVRGPRFTHLGYLWSLHLPLYIYLPLWPFGHVPLAHVQAWMDCLMIFGRTSPMSSMPPKLLEQIAEWNLVDWDVVSLLWDHYP